MGNRHGFDLRAIPGDAARRVRATRRRLNLALVSALALRAVAALTFGAGAAVLAAKVLGASVVAEPLLPLVAGVPAAAVAYALLRLGRPAAKLYTDREAAVLCDVAAGGGSLPLALAERADDPRLPEWRRSVRAPGRTPVRLRPFRLLRPVALPLAFLAGAIAVPERVPEVKRRRHALRRALTHTEEAAEALAEADVLEPEDLEDLREELAEMSSEGREPDSRAWEAVDAMDSRLARKTRSAADAAAWAMRAADSLAGMPLDDARQRELEAALDRLAKAGMLKGLPDELAAKLGCSAGGACRLPGDPEELKRMLRELDPYLAERAKKLCRSCRGAGGAGTEQALSDLAAYCEARTETRKGESYRLVEGDGPPGRGGINRGRGDAPMVWGEPCGKEGATFKPRRLPPGFRDPASAHTIASWLAEPEVGDARAGGRTGAAAGLDVGEASGRVKLSPARRELVKRYFTAGKGKGKTNGR